MTVEPVLIAGEWRAPRDPQGTLQNENPSTRQLLSQVFPVTGRLDVEDAIAAGKAAARELRNVPVGRIADFLDALADGMEEQSGPLVEMAHAETGLPVEPRLNSIELPRTTDQLRQAAAAARDGSWRRATIDTGSNIRSMLGPLDAPVVVFGPNNFPFAFNSASGGDFAAAIAAGNPVIAKANTGHPGTTRLIADIALKVLQDLDLPSAMVQLLYRTPRDVGALLVSHPDIGATGFTGSKAAGLQLKAAADQAGKPIYLEMSSVNPVFLLPGALRERGAELAAEFYASCAMGAGQFCTNPGLVILQDDETGREFIKEASRLFDEGAPQVLLGAGGPGDIAASVATLTDAGAALVTGGSQADVPGYAFENTLLTVSGKEFLQDPDVMQTEAFGTVSLLVLADDQDQMAAIAGSMEGNLTGCIYSRGDGEDDEAYDTVAAELRSRVGRLLNDKMPTGVAVVPSMNHGGPFPATGHPGFTAVGIPASLPRFAALHCYDEVRPHRLPPELRDGNPTGLWRLVDGQWTRD